MPSPYKRRIAKAMFKYIRCPTIATVQARPNLTDWPDLTRKERSFLERDPNAFLIACIFDGGVNAAKAWKVPYQLYRRLRHFDLTRLAALSLKTLEAAIRSGPSGAMHRFPRRMASAVRFAARRLISRYKGNAANIWVNGRDVRRVVGELLEFEQIGPKKAHMTVRLLIQYYGVRLSSWDKVDIAVDRHVARVFLRTGLVSPDRRSRSDEYPVVDLKDKIVHLARKLAPRYPGALDEPAFYIGQKWCKQSEACCAKRGKRPCPLATVCKQQRLDWKIG